MTRTNTPVGAAGLRITDNINPGPDQNCEIGCRICSRLTRSRSPRFLTTDDAINWLV